jgi:hypothetical protein
LLDSALDTVFSALNTRRLYFLADFY